jgi:hypothetical protein
MQYLVTGIFAFISYLLIAIIAFGTGYNFYKIRSLRKVASEVTVKFNPMPVPEFSQIINEKRYSTLDSKCLAQSLTLFGRIWLCKSSHGNYFSVGVTPFGIAIGPLEEKEAIQFFTASSKREVSFEDAFPNVHVVDA